MTAKSSETSIGPFSVILQFLASATERLVDIKKKTNTFIWKGNNVSTNTLQSTSMAFKKIANTRYEWTSKTTVTLKWIKNRSSITEDRNLRLCQRRNQLIYFQKGHMQPRRNTIISLAMFIFWQVYLRLRDCFCWRVFIVNFFLSVQKL